MRVAIVHDDLVQWGGAERVLGGICEIFPDAPIYTSVFDYSNNQLAQRFASKKIITSFLQKIPGWKKLYKVMLPFYPIAFEQFDFSDYNLVISHTTRFAKAVITKPRTRHICYCHTPPRFLWHFSGEGNYGILEPLMTKLRVYDQVSARRVDYFIAGSRNAQKRIKRTYGVDSKVVYPFVDLQRFKDVETFDGGYFVVMGRPSVYKRFEVAIEACKKVGVPLKIISGDYDDEMVVEILAGCKALIIPGIEDFGLSSLEAQALGKPVIAYRAGGALENVIEGVTGLFFEEAKVSNLIDTINRFNDLNHWNKNIIEKNASEFDKEKFFKNFKQVVASL
ncbi:glycosyltransferase [Candidatus Microgenomates bacterium]|nr:glycosyltransferase [Candidatus Microgenomates bacterium]